ncbi:MAG: dTDP-4-dehydrorhamnose reductase [Pyrinomonadaceae bacterium]
MKVVITGANGMVARAVARHCRGIGDDVSALTRQELDIGDRSEVCDLVASIRPDAVINCAAYTNVDGAESDPVSSELANAIGVENLAGACRDAGSGFVTISTDYVFDGANLGFYTQRDDPNPLSVYGKTKLGGERSARGEYARSIVVRSGWIYGTGGTNFLSIVHKLLAKGPISAIADSYGTPTFAEDLAVRLRELVELDIPGIYHVTNSGDGTSYAGFAHAVCKGLGTDPTLVKEVSHLDLKRPAPRPISSKLACLVSERFGLSKLRPWENALEEFISAERVLQE